MPAGRLKFTLHIDGDKELGATLRGRLDRIAQDWRESRVEVFAGEGACVWRGRRLGGAGGGGRPRILSASAVAEVRARCLAAGPQMPLGVEAQRETLDAGLSDPEPAVRNAA